MTASINVTSEVDSIHNQIDKNTEDLSDLKSKVDSITDELKIEMCPGDSLEIIRYKKAISPVKEVEEDESPKIGEELSFTEDKFEDKK